MTLEQLKRVMREHAVAYSMSTEDAIGFAEEAWRVGFSAGMQATSFNDRLKGAKQNEDDR